MKHIFFADVETRNFYFSAISDNAENAKWLVWKTWLKHCKQTGADKNYVSKDDIRIIPYEFGKGYRDFNAFYF